MLKKLLIAVICLTVVMGVITDVGLLCHSSCGTCPSFPRDINGCDTCSSVFLNYLPIAAGEAPKACTPDPNYSTHVNAQLLYTINGSCTIGDSHLLGYTLGGNNVTSQQTLASLGVYSSNNFMSSFTILTPEIMFSLTNLGTNHYGIYFRVYAYCEGTSAESFYYKVDGPQYPSISIGYNQFQLIEPSTMIKHTSNDLELSFGFGFTGTCTTREISEVSVYIIKCPQGCLTCSKASICLTCEPDYIVNSVTKKCIPSKFCHSQCGTCSVKNNATKCTSCSSSLQILSYLPFTVGQSESSCSMTSTNNAQILMTVNKNTVIGTSILKSVTYNGITELTNGNVLATFLYSNEVIEFKNLTNNVVTFEFQTPIIHQKIIVRARVFTECSAENRTLTMTLSGSATPIVITQTIPSMTESIIEGEIVQSADIFTVEFSYGSQSESCHKMIQDITIYYEKCLPYCGSNDCPDIMPYYKQLNTLQCVSDCSPYFADTVGLQCVIDCPDGYTENINVCEPMSFCSSTCGACSIKNDPTKCTTCSSTFTSSFFYDSLGDGVTEISCTFTPTNNAQYLLTIDKNSVIGSSHLQSVNVNSISQSTLGTPLSQILYSENTIEFMTLTSNTVSFTLETLPPHQKLFVRTRVFTECSASQNQSVNLILSGPTSVTVTKTLTSLNEDIIEAEVVHNDLTSTITIEFGTQSETCRKIVQDISIYYEKCESHCGSNSCPNVLPHFKLEGQNVCVKDCPNGYTESGTDCVKTAFCHSTCGECAVKNDANQCSTCLSTLGLNYNTLIGPGACVIPTTNNAQHLLTINKDTLIGTNELISVSYNSGTVQSTANTPLSPFLYTQNVIEFIGLTSNTVIFDFNNLPAQHEKVIVRARVFTECTTMQDQTIQLTLSGPTPTVVNTTLTPLLETIVEGEVLHTTSTFTLTVAFGTQSETCRKIVQDISLYFEKCSSFCGSNVCPVSLTYFKHPVNAVCVSDCPNGFTEVGDLCVETKFCHSTCGSCNVMNDATECTSCSSTLGSLVYEPFAVGVTESSCTMTTTNNAQLLMTVNKDTALGVGSLLKSVTYNSATETVLTPLSFFLYTQNVIEVSSLTSNTIVFDFDTLPIHQKLLVRARVFTECTTLSLQNRTVQMTLSGDIPTVIPQVLSAITTTIIEGEVLHNTATFTLTFEFGTQSETCRKQIQDISIYYEKCLSYCGSNDCPDVGPYYRHPTLAKCLSDCPDGYTESSLNCIPFEFCDSSCGTCLTKNDPLLCETCSSSLTSSLIYSPFSAGITEAPCTFDSLNNAQFLLKIDKSSVLGSGLLTSVIYDTTTVSTVGTLLSSFLYTSNVIEFSRFTSSNSVSFSFSSLPSHQKLIVRARLSTECTSENTTVQMTLTSTTSTVVSTTLTSGGEGLIEGEVAHDSGTFLLTFEFGSASENTCRKMIQDITIYSEKCKAICGSNVCPDTLPYYKHPDPLINECLSLCPAGYYESGDICQPISLCHSTCNTCDVKYDATSCTSCSSTLTSLVYDANNLPTELLPDGCNLESTNNAQILITIDKDTQIGNSILKNVTFNNANEATLGITLSSFLYTNNILDFVSLTSNRVEFYFDTLTIHKKLIVRAKVQSSCLATQNQTIYMTLEGPTPTVITQALIADQETIIEGEVVHSTSTFSIIVEFGTQGENCHKLLQDFTIFYEKCEPYCITNDCPNTEPYFKHLTLDKCINDCTSIGGFGDSLSNSCVVKCPLGRVGVGLVCVDYEFCSSSCGTCSVNNDPLKCTACPATTGLIYNPIPTIPSEGPCTMTTTNNAQELINIKKNTPLQTGYLKSVKYNLLTEITSGKLLSEFLYKRNVIEFDSFTSSNSVTFNLDLLPTHKNIIVRANVYTTCISPDDSSITMTIYGTPSAVFTSILAENVSTVIEGSNLHSSPILKIGFFFGIVNQNCRKMIQDITIYYEKCNSYCGSNDCPLVEPYYKHRTDLRCVSVCTPDYADIPNNVCVNDCHNGFTEDGVNCKTFEFCHSTCGQCAVKNNVNQCTTCLSTLGLNYEPFSTLTPAPGPCVIPTTNNAQHLLTINKDTLIGSNELISVTYNSGTIQSAANTPLSSFLYTQNVIEFIGLTSNTVIFDFNNLPAQHQKVIVRARVFTECTTMQDQTIQLTLSGPTPTVVNTTLTPLLETIVEGEVLHTTSTFTLTVAFGTQSDTCRKIVQDISLYFEKCSSFCGSNVCPVSLTYFKHPVNAVCVNDCPNGFTEVGDLCVETKFCHSTCGSCTITNDATKCTSCSSGLSSLVYEPFAVGVTESSCTMTTTNNAQLLMTVNKDTALGGTSLLKSVTYNSAPVIETVLTPLSAFLYTQNVIEVSSLTSNTIVFDFDTLPIHQKLLVRARVFTECTTLSLQNRTVQMTLSGDIPTVIPQVLSAITTTIIEGEVLHNTATFTLTFEFGTQVETCRKQIQDISIYFEKCQEYCGSNDCPDVGPYYRHPTLAKCVSVCPLGYIESLTNCVLTELCHSSCDNCLVKNDVLSCSSCPSTIPELNYDSLSSPGMCSLTLTNNAQLLMTVNKNTLLRTTSLKSITYNSVLHSTTGTALSTLLYSQNVIDFNTLTSNTVILGFDFLPIHKKLIVRAKVFTECSASQNQSLIMTLSGDIPTVVNNTLTPSIEQVIEGSIVHSLPAFTLTFSFGTQGENCRKIVQDISVYYEKCLPYCNSNDCPSIEPYYKQLGVDSCVNNCSPNFADPLDFMCVAVCPNGYTESGSSCVKVEMCHSTCGSCNIFNDATKCTSCSSGLTSLAYSPFAAGITASTCSPTPTNNAQYLMTVDKNILIGSSMLVSVGYNSISASTSGVTLGSLLYSENVIEFKGLMSNLISFDFTNLPIHQKLIVRVRAKTECIASQNQTLKLTLASTTPKVVTSTLTENVSTIVEGEVTHDATTFTLTIEFGTQGEVCRKMIHDISIFYEKCLPYCQSNNCPDTLPYYKHPSQSICVSQCPAGYIEAGQNCNPVDYCHSTCATCSLKLDPLQCSSCQSSYLLYASPVPITGTERACVISSTDKWVPIMSIDKNTILGTSLLKNVTYNTNIIASTSGTTLSSFLYTQNTIEFSSLTNNLIRLEFSGLPTHFRLFARIRVYTECTIENMTVVASLDGSPTTYTLTSSTEELIETTPIDHNAASLVLTIEFGTQSENCRKMVQDISLFGQKCAAYCTSCIDGGSVKQFGSTNCLLTCPAGQFISSDGTQCLQCSSPCAECSGSATNCTRCSIVAGTQYYFNDTAPNDPLTGGVCVTRCLSNFYENITTESCQLCNPMCLSCVNTPSNCTQCSAYGGQNYFLQPSATGCLLTCPVGYYPNTLTFTCTLCDSRCSSCTGPSNDSCSACKVDNNNIIHYLVANTTTCTDRCDDNRFYANATTFKCEPCDSNCDTCSIISTNCTTCKTSRFSQFIYMEGNKCMAACSANLLLYNNTCIATCPEGTKESSVNNTLMCTICDGACSKPTFKMETVVINNGKELSHKVNFETGLHPSNTAQGIKNSVKLWLVSQEGRRLLQESDDEENGQLRYFAGHKTRLLLRLQLSVDDLIISSDYQSITVLTPNPFSSSSLEQLISTRIEIEFLAPVNDANGVPYTQTISDFSLEDKKFIESFYSQIGNDEYMAIGIVLCILTAIAFIFSFYVYNRKVIHELLYFIMTIEIIGLIRMRAYAYPYIDLSWTLFGFSMFEFDWIPNSLKLLYPTGYIETIYTNVSLTYDNQSLFTTWGSTLQIFVAMELALVIYYLVCKFRALEPIKQVRERTKFIQHCILSLVMVKTVFSNILCLTSFSIMESTTNVSVIFWVAELFSILIFLVYFIYFVLHVRKSSKEVILERIRNGNISVTPQKPTSYNEMSLNQTTTNFNSPSKVSPMKGSPEKFDLNHPEIAAEFLSETSENPQSQEELTGLKRCLANTKFEEIQMYKIFAFLKAIFVVIVISSKGFGGIILINIVEVAYFAIDMYFWRHERYNLKLFILDEILTLVAYNTACFVQYDTEILHGLIIVSVYGIFLIKTYYVVTAYLLKRNQQNEEPVKEEKEFVHDNIIQMVPIEKESVSNRHQSKNHQSVRNNISMESELQEENLPDNKLITIGSDKELRRTHTNNLKDIEYEEVFDYRNVETIDYAEVPTGQMDERDEAKLKNKNPTNPQDRDTIETAYGTFYQQKESPTNNSRKLRIKQSNIFEEDNNIMNEEERSSRNELISINSHDSMIEQQNLNQRKKRVRSNKEVNPLPQLDRKKSTRGNEIRLVDQLIEDKEVEVINVESKPVKKIEEQKIVEKPKEIVIQAQEKVENPIEENRLPVNKPEEQKVIEKQIVELIETKIETRVEEIPVQPIIEEKVETKIEETKTPIVDLEVSNKIVVDTQTFEKQEISETVEHHVPIKKEVNKFEPVKHDDFKELLLMNFNSTPVPSEKIEEIDHRPSTSYDDGQQRVKKSRKAEKPEMLLVWEENEQENKEEEIHRPATSYVSNENDLLNSKPSLLNIPPISPIIEEPSVILSNKLNDSLSEYEELVGENINIEEKFISKTNEMKEEKVESKEMKQSHETVKVEMNENKSMKENIRTVFEPVVNPVVEEKKIEERKVEKSIEMETQAQVFNKITQEPKGEIRVEIIHHVEKPSIADNRVEIQAENKTVILNAPVEIQALKEEQTVHNQLQSIEQPFNIEQQKPVYNEHPLNEYLEPNNKLNEVEEISSIKKE